MKPTTRVQLEARLRYYEDLGIRDFYRDRVPGAGALLAAPSAPTVTATQSGSAALQETRKLERATFASARGAASSAPTVSVGSRAVAATPVVIPVVQEASLFGTPTNVADDTLARIKADIGDDCRRCNLCRKRKTIVFGDGNPRAELVFVGEGPGAEEDEQGLPFVGRAGKLLTQMIEAMGLKRSDVYICNVVKCRPPDNRVPEKDEVAECSPFLFRQIAVIQPKVVVGLGASALQALLGAPVAITKIHGEWIDWRGTKLMPIYHPAYLLRNPPAKPDAWRDLQKVMAFLGLPMPKK